MLRRAIDWVVHRSQRALYPHGTPLAAGHVETSRRDGDSRLLAVEPAAYAVFVLYGMWSLLLAALILIDR